MRPPSVRPSLLLGSDPAADVAAFKEGGGHLLVGTPGRLDDVMQRCPTMDLRTGGRGGGGGGVRGAAGCGLLGTSGRPPAASP